MIDYPFLSSGLVPDPVPHLAPSRALNLQRLLLAHAKSLDLLLLPLGAARKKTLLGAARKKTLHDAARKKTLLDAAKTTTTKEASTATVPVDRARRLGGRGELKLFACFHFSSFKDGSPYFSYQSL